MSKPKEWEYKVVPHTNGMYNGSLENILNLHGADGWELVSFEVVGPNYWIFKREKQD